MPEPSVLEFAFIREYRLRDAEKLVGLSTRQILHAGATKLKFADWHTGKGNPRLLTMLELFQLRLLSAVDQRVPIKAMQHLADLGEVYFTGVLSSAPQRRKPAVVVGYPDAKGAWWWLLGVDGKWPENPPPPGSEMLVIVRIREVLGRLLQAIIDHIRNDLGDAMMPDDFQSSLAADLQYAGTVARLPA
jgi:hypothetical protein